MTNREKAAALRTLEYHLEKYRFARRNAALRAMRLQMVPETEAAEVSHHAIGIAEALDRLGGSTR